MTRLELAGFLAGFAGVEFTVAGALVHPALGWAVNGLLVLALAALIAKKP